MTDWADSTIAQLRKFWAEGLSTSEIGRRLKISKNAVVGKAHRLALPARPSPIRNAPAGLERMVQKPATLVRGKAATLPPLSTVPCAPIPDAREIAAVPVFKMRPKPCCWPIGEPGKPSFHFCGVPGIAGKPYCVAHDEIAFVRREREQAA
jgi:GcrA cell cycle regulator